MTPAMWAILLRPLLFPVFFALLVAPLAWLLYRSIPEGRLKVMLFRVRTGAHATRRDKWVMSTAVIVAYIVFIVGAWTVA